MATHWVKVDLRRAVISVHEIDFHQSPAVFTSPRTNVVKVAWLVTIATYSRKVDLSNTQIEEIQEFAFVHCTSLL